MKEKKTTPYANSLFEQPWWLDIVAPGEWDEVLVKEGEEVVGRLPFVLNKREIKMPQLTQTLGPWIKPEYREMTIGNSQLSLQKTNYHKAVKKNIRRAQKMITISNEPDAELLYSIMEKTFEHQGRHYPISRDFVIRIVERTMDTNNGRMFIAKDETGNIHACSYLVYDEKSSYALIGGADPEFRNSGAKSYLWKEEIEYASKESKYFDFEGSNIESIENFVRQFGGNIVTYYRVYKGICDELADIFKPRIKRLIGYKI